MRFSGRRTGLWSAESPLALVDAETDLATCGACVLLYDGSGGSDAAYMAVDGMLILEQGRLLLFALEAWLVPWPQPWRNANHAC